MDTPNDGLEHVVPLNMAFFGIYVKFLGYIYIYVMKLYVDVD